MPYSPRRELAPWQQWGGERVNGRSSMRSGTFLTPIIPRATMYRNSWEMAKTALQSTWLSPHWMERISRHRRTRKNWEKMHQAKTEKLKYYVKVNPQTFYESVWRRQKEQRSICWLRWADAWHGGMFAAPFSSRFCGVPPIRTSHPHPSKKQSFLQVFPSPFFPTKICHIPRTVQLSDFIKSMSSGRKERGMWMIIDPSSRDSRILDPSSREKSYKRHSSGNWEHLNRKWTTGGGKEYRLVIGYYYRIIVVVSENYGYVGECPYS